MVLTSIPDGTELLKVLPELFFGGVSTEAAYEDFG